MSDDWKVGIIRCKVIENTREENGKFTIRGVAASTAIVHEDWEPEMFPADVLKRDGHTLVGTPILDGHSDWPYRVKISDYLGEVLGTDFEDDGELLRFDGELWDENAKQVAKRKMMEYFSVAYAMKSHVDDKRDGLIVADEIKFAHLGFLENPADEKAVLEEILERAKKGMETEYVAPDELPCPDGMCDSGRSRNLHHFGKGLEAAKRDGKWGHSTSKI